MNNRRNFIKAMIAGGVGLALAQNTSLLARSKVITKNTIEKVRKTITLPMNIVFSEKEKGKWTTKNESHVPEVTVKDGKVTIETKHIMNEKHYIIRHTLVTSDGDYIDGKTFYPEDKKAISVFDLPKNKKSFIATSYCNLHDLWINEFTIK